MLKKTCSMVALLCAATCIQAAEPTPMAKPSGISPFVGLGLTIGGDQIGRELQYTDGGSQTIHAGGTLEFMGGLEYQAIGSPLSFQFGIGYHSDGAFAASNGNASFHRIPLEVLMHFKAADSLRLGIGLRKALSAETSSSGEGRGYVRAEKYSSSVGVILEGEYFFTPAFALKLRAVSEKYQADSAPDTDVDGSHIGVFGMYYFQ